MTTTVLTPHNLDTAPDDNHRSPLTRTADGESTRPAGETVTGGTVTGEVVTGPLRLNLGDDGFPTIRAGLLDPRQLHDNPRNPRTKPYDLADILTSVRERGVRVPLLLISVPAGTPTTDVDAPPAGQPDPAVESDTVIGEVTDEQIASLLAPMSSPQTPAASDEQFMILMGHRRKYAAIEAGRDQVPCWIVPDEGVANQIMDMLIENGHRTALTATEEAEAYHQLTLEGLSPEQIAAMRAVPTSVVKTALRARQLPQQAQRALDNGTLTLEQAMALEEFKDSPRARDRLLRELGNEWLFKQALASERDKRDYATAKERAKAQLVLDGVKATAKPAGYGYDSPAAAVDDLVDGDGNALDVEQVKKLPGVAAFVEKVGAQARTVVYVEDPAALGYTKRPRPRYGMTAEQAAADAERQRADDERRDQLRLAAGVRREFVQATYGTAKAARKLYVEALRAAVSGQHLNLGTTFDELYKALGGADHATLATAGEDRLRRALVAKWVCRQELNLTYIVEHTWNLDKDAAVAWYDRLIAEGYPLTDAEQAAYQSLTGHDNEDDDEEQDEDDDEDGGEEEYADDDAPDGGEDNAAHDDSAHTVAINDEGDTSLNTDDGALLPTPDPDDQADGIDGGDADLEEAMPDPTVAGADDAADQPVDRQDA